VKIAYLVLAEHTAWAALQDTQSSKTSPLECCTVKEKIEGKKWLELASELMSIVILPVYLD